LFSKDSSDNSSETSKDSTDSGVGNESRSKDRATNENENEKAQGQSPNQKDKEKQEGSDEQSERHKDEPRRSSPKSDDSAKKSEGGHFPLPFGFQGEGSSWKNLFVSVGLFLLFTYFTTVSNRKRNQKISWSEFQWDLLAEDKVCHLRILNERSVVVFLKRPNEKVLQQIPWSSDVRYFDIGSVESFEHRLDEVCDDLQIPLAQRPPITYGSSLQAADLIRWSPTLLLIGFYIATAMYFTRSKSKGGGAGGFGQMFGLGTTKKFKPEKGNTVRFADVAGCEEAKQEVTEFVSFLRHPEKYKELGARIPKGAILIGPPGCGKTLLAKATAGEAGVPFFSVSGSDFVEMFVGVGPSRVRDLFKEARAAAPSIIFIDEIDAIGRKRGGRRSGGNDERENTLNQILVEMDGFKSTDDNVVVLAGTNIPKVLDKALLRPGRFDRQIELGNPDVKSREEIFAVHMKPLPLAADDLHALAQELAELTPGFSGADIANVCNEAALIAARRDENKVHKSDFEAAVERVIGGLEKKNKVMSKEEKIAVAYHEAGHAVVSWFLRYCAPLLKVSIVPRGSAALGYAQYKPKEQFLYTTEQLLDTMCKALGGRVAEELALGKISTGAQDDLDKVTDLAYSQITKWGMDPEIGNVSFPSSEGEGFYRRPYSDATATLIDEHARKLVIQAYERTRSILKENLEGLEKVAKYLLEHEVMSYAEVESILGPRPFQEELEEEARLDKEERQRIEEKRKKLMQFGES